MKKSILYVSATYPPRSGSGVQRPFYQAECFASLGTPVYVITSSDTSVGFDSSLHPVQVPEEDIARLPRYASLLSYWIDRFLRKLGFISYPDSFSGWGLRACMRIGKLIKTKQPIALFVSLGSPSALLAAAFQKRLHPHVRLHIDVRDFWVGSELGGADYRRGATGTALNRRLESWAFRQADSVSCVSPSLRSDLERRYPWLDGCVHVIENGFDEASFKRATDQLIQSESTQLVLRHLGTIVSSQKLEIFLQAVRQIENEDPTWVNDVSIEFYGGTPRFIEKQVSAAGMPGSVRVFGYADHNQALELMLGSDVLLLFWAPGASTVGGKAYEYLRAGRYILGFEQGNIDGPALIRRYRRGEVVPISSPTDIKKILRSLLLKKRSGAPFLQHPLEDVNAYSRDAQNRELLQIVLTRK